MATRKRSRCEEEYELHQQKRRKEALKSQKGLYIIETAPDSPSTLEEGTNVGVQALVQDEQIEDVPDSTLSKGDGPDPEDSGEPDVGVRGAGLRPRHRQVRRKKYIDGHHPKQYYSAQFMVPEWMTDVPQDLQDHWLLMPRPEGLRCLVTAHGGRTVSRLRSGTVLHRYSWWFSHESRR